MLLSIYTAFFNFRSSATPPLPQIGRIHCPPLTGSRNRRGSQSSYKTIHDAPEPAPSELTTGGSPLKKTAAAAETPARHTAARSCWNLDGVWGHRPRPTRRGAQVVAQEPPPCARPTHHDLATLLASFGLPESVCLPGSTSSNGALVCFLDSCRASWPSRRICQMGPPTSWSGSASSPASKA